MAPLRTFWATLRARLSPPTLTVTSIPSPSMLRMALPSLPLCQAHFLVWQWIWLQQFIATKGGRPYGPRGLQGVKVTWTTSLSKRKRGPCPRSGLQHTENLLTSTVSIPDPLKKGRGFRSPTLSCTINKFHCTPRKVTANMLNFKIFLLLTAIYTCMISENRWFLFLRKQLVITNVIREF